MKMADAKQKRNEQLKRWIGSETDLEPPVVKRKKTKVKFDDGAVFLAACSSGDTEEVLRLLERGADINYANVDGLTALHQVGAGPIVEPPSRTGAEGGRGRPSTPPRGGGGGGRGRRRLRSLRWGVSGRGGGGRVSLGPAGGRGPSLGPAGLQGWGGCTPSPRAGRRKGRMGLSCGGKEVPLTLFRFPLLAALPSEGWGERALPRVGWGGRRQVPPGVGG